MLKRRIGALGKATAPGWSRRGAALPSPTETMERSVKNSVERLIWIQDGQFPIVENVENSEKQI